MTDAARAVHPMCSMAVEKPRKRAVPSIMPGFDTTYMMFSARAKPPPAAAPYTIASTKKTIFLRRMRISGATIFNVSSSSGKRHGLSVAAGEMWKMTYPAATAAAHAATPESMAADSTPHLIRRKLSNSLSSSMYARIGARQMR